MDFRARTLEPADYEFCISATRDGFAFTQDELDDLRRMWLDLSSKQMAIAEIIEDISVPPDKRAVCFGYVVFPNQEFVARLALSPEPFVSKLLLKEWRAGRVPLLTYKEICSANSPNGCGLTMLTISSGGSGLEEITDWQKASPYQLAIMGWFPEWFLRGLSGYHLNQLIMEVYGSIQAEWCRNTGFFLRSSYPEFSDQIDHFPKSQKPSLFGLDKDEAATTRVGSMMASLLLYRPPRFGFRPSEQRLLMLAVDGKRDDEIASILGISINTVHTRWREILERTASSDDQMLVQSVGKGSETVTRGTEKRRKLLSYLHYHREELRPIKP